MANVTLQDNDNVGNLPLMNNGKANPGGAKVYRLSQIPKWVYLLAVLGFISIGGVVGMYFQPPGLKFFFNSTGITPGGGSDQPIAVAPKPQVRTNQEQFNGIKALGRLMPFDDIAVVAPPFGAGDARVAKIFVKEGQQVAANDVIAELDSLAQLQSALNMQAALR